MCGILAILGVKTDADAARRQALALARLLRHRGPDASGLWSDERAVIAHERLAIVDPATGGQPFVDPVSKLVLAVNGEIYNHQALRAQLGAGYQFMSESDCESIIPLYLQRGASMFDQLEGMFAFVLYSPLDGRYLIARDHLGIIPLYYGEDEAGQLVVASELKALLPVCRSFREFPPGHFLDSAIGEPRRYYHPSWQSYEAVGNTTLGLPALRAALERSVESHMMSDVPFGVLLSGGLDSSLISAIAAEVQRGRSPRAAGSDAGALHSFAIGLEQSPDLAAANQVAAAIGSVHHRVVYTEQQGIDAVGDVIYALETYDVTTIRAATPMYLLARRIKSLGLKMVLSGEGSDEIFGGYLYFHHAPNPLAFHQECLRKLERLHLFDCLRANKAMAAWGVEVRVPFLDKRFLDVAMDIAPREKMCGNGKIEKHVLREAFHGLLPPAVLWRQKEQFSDGVGYRWIDCLKEWAEREVTDRQLANAEARFSFNTPDTKEAYLYRALFEQHFPHPDAIAGVPGGKSVACSTPEALSWRAHDPRLADPSGRAVRGVHVSAY
jgi:asparagine synthase (glutamine-hydrolysing)